MEEPADKERFLSRRAFFYPPPGFHISCTFLPLVSSEKPKSILAVRLRGKKKASVVSEFTQSDVPFLWQRGAPTRSPPECLSHALPPPPAIPPLSTWRESRLPLSVFSCRSLCASTHPVTPSLICSPVHFLAGIRAFRLQRGAPANLVSSLHGT